MSDPVIQIFISAFSCLIHIIVISIIVKEILPAVVGVNLIILNCIGLAFMIASIINNIYTYKQISGGSLICCKKREGYQEI